MEYWIYYGMKWNFLYMMESTLEFININEFCDLKIMSTGEVHLLSNLNIDNKLKHVYF